MALEIIESEEGSNSFRIKHPDFGDVYKTVYRKGIIKELKKVQDDPITFESLAKVEIEGQETEDYLPLFYHPKKQYWDDDHHQATDFNEELRYFERAWMSFRPGDEVVVMLQENKPVLIIGFADATPKVGENIIRMEFYIAPFEDHRECNYDPSQSHDHSVPGSEHTVYLNALKKKIDDDPDLPEPTPDGTPLGLTKECERILFEQEHWNFDRASWNTTIHEHFTFTMADWIAIVGPIIYIFQFVSRKDDSVWEPVGESWIRGWGSSAGVDGVYVSALPYSKENLEEIRQAAANPSIQPKDASMEASAQWGGRLGPWGIQYRGAVKQEDFFMSVRMSFTGIWDMDLEQTKLFVRPHSQDDEAGEET